MVLAYHVLIKSKQRKYHVTISKKHWVIVTKQWKTILPEELTKCLKTLIVATLDLSFEISSFCCRKATTRSEYAWAVKCQNGFHTQRNQNLAKRNFINCYRGNCYNIFKMPCIYPNVFTSVSILRNNTLLFKQSGQAILWLKIFHP